jgi:arylsulfatase A-like enzyme
MPRSPWAEAVGFGAAALAVLGLGRALMLMLAAGSGGLADFPWWAYFPWLAAELARDLGTSLALTLLVGVGLAYLPPRGRAVWHSFGYALLLACCVIVFVSVPLFAALHSTLQFTQILLAGGAEDLFDAGLATLPWPVYVGAVLVLGATCLCVPLLAAGTGRRLPRLLGRRGLLAVLSALLVLAGLGRLAPEDTQALRLSAVYDFAVGAGRYYVRTRGTRLDMSHAPHFDASLMYGTPPALEATESLVDVGKLPLHRPNVVLVVLESASIAHTGLWNGHPEDTPRLSQMAQKGLIFDEYYSPSPVSMKSLFSMSCSSYPHTAPEAETYTNPSIDCLSISELLKNEGYRTGLFHGGHFSYTRKDAFFRNRRYDLMRDATTLVNRRKYKRVMWGADDRAVIDDALQWVENGPQNVPFFLHISFLAPHEPYLVNDVPEPYGTKTNVDRYRNATLFIDSQVGRVWDWLHAQGKADDTLLVVVGDHGESFGEHRGDFMHGGRIYESAVHTPLMLVQPRLFAGKRSARVGNHLDLVPTILDVLGIAKPPRQQGASLLRGYKPHMLYFYADWQRHYLGLRDGQWKYIYTVDSDHHELYDLSADRAEKNNLAARMPDRSEAYDKRLRAWEGFYRELIPNYERYVNGTEACEGKVVCHLDELKPIFQHGTLRRGLSAGGRRLQLGRTVYEHGLGVSPLSIVRFNIRGDGFRRFQGGVGHHAMGGNANLSLKVSTEIYLDDRLIWSSGKLTADEPAKTFDLDIAHGAVLELIGYDVDAEDWRDFIDWVEVRLTR